MQTRKEELSEGLANKGELSGKDPVKYGMDALSSVFGNRERTRGEGLRRVRGNQANEEGPDFSKKLKEFGQKTSEELAGAYMGPVGKLAVKAHGMGVKPPIPGVP